MNGFRLNLGQPEQQTQVDSTTAACAVRQGSIQEVLIAEASRGKRKTAVRDMSTLAETCAMVTRSLCRQRVNM